LLPIGVGVYACSLYQRIQQGEDGVFLLCHDMIRAWSHVEIIANQVWDKYHTLVDWSNEYVSLFGGVETTTTNPTAQLRTIEYIKDGKKMDMPFKHDDDCDFAIYSDIQAGRKCVYKKIVPIEKTAHFGPSLNGLQDKFEPILDWHFLSFEIMASINGVSKLFKIKLQTDEYNFYQVGNRLTPEFFHYYLQTIHSPPVLDIETMHIDTLTIVDSNVTYAMDTFSEHERVEILLNKEDYTIVKSAT